MCARIDSKAHLRDVKIARRKRVLSRLGSRRAPHGLQRTVENNKLVARGRQSIEQMLVNAGIASRIE